MLKFSVNIWKLKGQPKNFTIVRTNRTNPADPSCNKPESDRMKAFHDKLKVGSLPRLKPAPRFVELALVDIDPNTGELVSDREKNPTRWGDWQQNCRVTDF